MDLSLKRISDYIEWHRTHWVRLPAAGRMPLLDLFSLFDPEQARGYSKIRVGDDRDGGYVMLDDFDGVTSAVSLGIGPDVSWDLALAERGIRVAQYDHTVERPPQSHALFQFERKKIAAEPQGPNEVSLDEALTQAGDGTLLLKIDIEGDEWEVLDRIDVALLAGCRQIVMEFHDFRSVTDSTWAERAGRVLRKLKSSFGVVHVHGNNLSSRLLLPGHTLPDSLEVTFANRSRYELVPSMETFPGIHDRKNNRFFPDFKLGRFRFDSTEK